MSGEYNPKLSNWVNVDYWANIKIPPVYFLVRSLMLPSKPLVLPKKIVVKILKYCFIFFQSDVVFNFGAGLSAEDNIYDVGES